MESDKISSIVNNLMSLYSIHKFVLYPVQREVGIKILGKNKHLGSILINSGYVDKVISDPILKNVITELSDNGNSSAKVLEFCVISSERKISIPDSIKDLANELLALSDNDDKRHVNAISVVRKVIRARNELSLTYEIISVDVDYNLRKRGLFDKLWASITLRYVSSLLFAASSYLREYLNFYSSM